jgi:phosphoribosylanthranilate isomerase
VHDDTVVMDSGGTKGNIVIHSSLPRHPKRSDGATLNSRECHVVAAVLAHASDVEKRPPIRPFTGGLTPENVAEAIRIVRPYAVDVASGVESEAGRKDGERMKRFVEGVRG